MVRTAPLMLILSAVIALMSLAIRAEPETDEPLPPEQAARSAVVPAGFNVSLFAGEPDVMQPIGFCIDDRGRIWVAEAYNYPNHGTTPGDRIIILEDLDHDGRFDKRTVFFDKLNYVTGIEVGFGGAWVMSPPFFYFIPDKNGDDIPDGEPVVLLDGFGNHANAHNLANGFAWGPDGWLYGTHGRTNWSLIGTPGTPDELRERFDGGVWRYHPIRHVWEPFADGTTNPWGIDWDDYGQAFVCNCVNPHLFHVIQGAHYEPWRNRESSRFAYQRIDTIADHLHFVGKDNVRDGLGSAAEDAAGGGHAHCGTMIYLGDNWPDRYRNHVFMNNIHGKRINQDLLSRKGSGYTATHAPDLLRSKDPWFMGVTLQYGPDGSVFVSDWSDTGECHSIKNTRRHTGRIFRIAYGSPPPPQLDLASATSEQLVAYQRHRNDWWVRHARRNLQERFAAGADLTAARERLFKMFTDEPDIPRKLRALWALHVTGGAGDAFLVEQLRHSSDDVRAWAVTLLCENKAPAPGTLRELVGMAVEDPSPRVRLHLASALQRLEPADRWDVAQGLIAHAEDASDQNLPLMIWYGIEPLATTDPQRFISLGTTSRLPLVDRHIARRVAEFPEPGPGLEILCRQIAQSDSASWQSEILSGILIGLEGRRTVPQPTNWPAAYERLRSSPLPEVRDRAVELALIFDDAVAIAQLKTLMMDTNADPLSRQKAIDALVRKRVPDLAPRLLQLVEIVETRRSALRGLAEYDDPATPGAILSKYGEFDAASRQDALQTLASRLSWGMELVDAVAKGTIPRTDVTAFTARQLLNLGNEELNKRIEQIWGKVRETGADKARLIVNYQKRLTSNALAGANPVAGRALFQKLCANCHRLFDAGGEVGPNLTGAQRTNLDYLLENLIDPSASVSKDFQMAILATESGRVITGLVLAETDAAVTVQTLNEKVVIPKSEIVDRAVSDVSLMPDGLLNQLSFEQIRDLIGYLRSPEQVSLPGASMN